MKPDISKLSNSRGQIIKKQNENNNNISTTNSNGSSGFIVCVVVGNEVEKQRQQQKKNQSCRRNIELRLMKEFSTELNIKYVENGNVIQVYFLIKLKFELSRNCRIWIDA